MDHSENDKRFYVYVHKDQDGIVRYVGQGTRDGSNITDATSSTYLLDAADEVAVVTCNVSSLVFAPAGDTVVAALKYKPFGALFLYRGE